MFTEDERLFQIFFKNFILKQLNMRLKHTIIKIIILKKI